MPRTPSLFCARPIEQATLGESAGYREESRRQALWDLTAVKAVFRCRHPQPHSVEHLVLSSKTARDLSTPGATRGSDRNRSARIRCGPPLISQPHACPLGIQPHQQPSDPMRLASSRPCHRADRRDPGRTRDPGILCGWPCLRGVLIYFNSRK
jgi:hypothetical protein